MSSYKRIAGKSLHVTWPVTVNGGEIPLADCKLTLHVIDPWERVFTLPVEASADGKAVEFLFPGTLLNVVGDYTFVIWYDFGEKSQSLTDTVNALTLVEHAFEEEDPEAADGDISVDEPVVLDAGDIQLGGFVDTNEIKESIEALARLIADKADRATTIEGYGITDANIEANLAGMFINLGGLRAKIPTRTSDLTNDSEFLSQHQDISGKADKSYVDTELAKKQGTISDLATIRSGAAKGATALQSFTEADPTVPSFVKSITQAMINAWSGKQDAITDLATIRSGAAAGATALQSFTESDPTVPAHVKSITEANITSWNGKQASISDLATIRSNATNGNTAYGYFSGGKLPYSSLSGTPTIPAAVTEQTVSGWGFTKNTGTYSKPSGGIPKSDLSSDVQATLNKLDELYDDYSTALNLI